MRIEEGLAKWLVQLEADGRSEHTRKQYARHIGLFTRWLGDRALETIGHEDLARFLVSAEATMRPDGKRKLATSMNALRTSVRTFFWYLHAVGLVPANPARLVRRARCGPGVPRALSESDCERLVAAIEAAVQCAVPDEAASRDHALVTLLLATGMRIGSALALRIEDLDADTGQLVLRQVKNGRQQALRLDETALRVVLRSIGDRTEGPVFVSRAGSALSTRHVQRRLGMWGKLAGLRRPVRCHDLRHTRATRLYAETRDLLAVQAALGHASIVSSAIYARTCAS